MADKREFFMVFFLAVFSISFASASFSLGSPNSSISSIYGPSGNITGWVNISFSAEPLNATFTDNNANRVNLSDMLSRNPAYIYTCSPTGCGDAYQALGSFQTKTVTMNPGDTKTYGIMLTGNITGIDSIDFNLSSTAAASCTNQIEVDFLNDNSTDFRNTNVGDVAGCSSLRNYGCFDQSQSFQQPIIGATPYCEQINLSSSPGFQIGAWIRPTGTSTINATLYDKFMQKLTSCTLPEPASGGSEVFCGVNYPVVNTDQYYVCINSVSGSGSYTTKEYDVANGTGCGFYGTAKPSQLTSAYQIFAQGEQFGPVGTENINQSLYTGQTLADMANQYINQLYPNKDCSAGCILPIKITSDASQEVTLSSMDIKYEKQSGVFSDSNFYELSVAPARITSNNQTLYLDGSGLSVQSSKGNYTYSLSLDGQNIINQKIQVSNIPSITSLSPLQTAAAYPTLFTAGMNSSYNITGVYWDFGDNSTAFTPSGNATHTYIGLGTYIVKVTATDQRGINGSATFNVNVTSPKGLIVSNLYQMQINLAVIKNQISSYPKFYQDAINASLNLSNMASALDEINQEYQNASTDADYANIVPQILSLNIPAGIAKIATGMNLPYYSGPDKISMAAVQGIDSQTYDTTQEQGYINGVLLWEQQNLDTTFSFDEFSGINQGYLTPITNIYKITVSEKTDIPYDYYLIIPQLQGFTTNAQYNTTNGYIYINMKSQPNVFFSTTEDLNLTDLPGFISPSVSQITVTTTLPEEKTISKWITFSIIAIILFLAGVTIYVLLGRWYDRRYENYLFKNRNDLYNMVTYVNNAKRKGMKNSQIAENLKKVGWSAERIRYVIRKYAGKGTGMLGFNTKITGERQGGKQNPPR